jgi:hypothetical protein
VLVTALLIMLLVPDTVLFLPKMFGYIPCCAAMWPPRSPCWA